MFFHFKLVIAITTLAKDISLELMAGWEAEPRATGSSQLAINPQEIPAPSIIIAKAPLQKILTVPIYGNLRLFCKTTVCTLVKRPPLSTEDVIIKTAEGKILFS